MDRREFLKSTSAAAAAAAATTASTAAAADTRKPSTPDLAAPAVTKGIRQLRMASPWGDGVSGLADEAFQLARTISYGSEGQLTVELIDTTGAETSRGAIAAIASGEADIFHGLEHDNAAHQPAYAFFSGLPHTAGMTATDFESWINVGGGQSLWDRLSADHNVKPFLVGHLGATPHIWSKHSLAKRNNFDGLHIATVGLGAAVVNALGGTAETVPATALEDALANGRIDAAEWGNAYHNMTLGMHKPAGYAATPGIHANGTAVSLGINRKLWESLTPTHQAVVSAAASAAYRNALVTAKQHKTILHKTLSSEHKLAFEQNTGELTAAIHRISDAVVAQIAANDATAARINSSFMAFKRLAALDGALSPPEVPSV